MTFAMNPIGVYLSSVPEAELRRGWLEEAEARADIARSAGP
jgi:hypothetical protein